jgi:hypothetical protein
MYIGTMIKRGVMDHCNTNWMSGNFVTEYTNVIFILRYVGHLGVTVWPNNLY